MLENMKALVKKLKRWCYAYYELNNPEVPDSVYDAEFDKLVEMEKETGIVLEDSPTKTVGTSIIQSAFKKVKHNHPMLSLDKVKTIEEIYNFGKGKMLVGMSKCDGLTVSLTYDEHGDFIRAETRGDGEVGEDVTENVKMISNVPMKINCTKKTIIDGEVIVKKDIFNKINASLDDDDKFAHPRNYASGSLRQLNPAITKERQLSFIAWKYIEGDFDNNEFSNSFLCRLSYIEELGFEKVPITVFQYTNNKESDLIVLRDLINFFKGNSNDTNTPIDGVVWGFNDVAYGNSLGITEHHVRSQIAYKYPVNKVKTVLRDVKWKVGKSGRVNPKAVFDEIDLDGSMTSNATLNNVTFMKDMEIGIGDIIYVAKMNEIIPNVVKNETRSNSYQYPTECPCCHSPLVSKADKDSETLWCENINCPERNLSKYVQFVSKQGMNIDGLSKKKLEALIEAGYIHDFASIFELKNYPEIADMEGWGDKSYKKLLEAIEKARTVKLSNFLVALSIPNVGKSVAKTIYKAFKGDYNSFIQAGASDYDFSVLDDVGDVINQSIKDWINFIPQIEKKLVGKLIFDASEFVIGKNNENINRLTTNNDFCKDKTFVVTGKFVHYKREEISQMIEDRGGKLAGSVSKKTNYLLTNDSDSGSTKAKKAQELNIPIMSEEEFLKAIGVST